MIYEKRLKEIRRDGNLSLLIAFCLIVIGAVCFYKEDSIPLFIGMNGIAGIIVAWHAYARRGLRIYITPFIIWITLLFALFLIYGYGFLRAGEFNGDKFIFMYAESWLLYYIVKRFLTYNNSAQLFAVSCSICAIVCMVMLYVNEGQMIFLRTETRLGTTLAGNSNSVGMSLGLMSLFITNYFGKSKKRKYLFLLLIIAVFMLTTGSKKALVYLLFDGMALYSYSRDKIAGLLKVVIVVGALAYLVFCVDFFYNIIGFRIIDMLGALGFRVAKAQWSYSTTSRMIMLNEAYHYWLESPIWGSGMNYFYSRSVTGLGYSHSNIMELLCNMGLIGCLLYYFPFINVILYNKRIRRVDKRQAHFIFGASIVIIIMGFMAVGYSDSCVSYLMAIYCFAYYELYVRGRKTNEQARYDEMALEE